MRRSAPTLRGARIAWAPTTD